MDAAQIYAISLGGSLVALGGFLTSSAWSSWKNPPRRVKNREEAALLEGRLGRRLHTSIALMGLGAAVALGGFLGRERITAIYWYGVVALALWMCVLAILDGGATLRYILKVRGRIAQRRAAILNQIAARAAKNKSMDEPASISSQPDALARAAPRED